MSLLKGMKVASFFAGCGGLDLGFEQAGYEVVWANELMKQYIKLINSITQILICVSQTFEN